MRNMLRFALCAASVLTLSLASGCGSSATAEASSTRTSESTASYRGHPKVVYDNKDGYTCSRYGTCSGGSCASGTCAVPR